MIEGLQTWARGRRSRPGLLVRARLGIAEPEDAALREALTRDLMQAPTPPGLAAAAWRLIEIMDLAAPEESRVTGLESQLAQRIGETLPLVLPSGAVASDATTAALAGEALALRALTKAGAAAHPVVRDRLDEMARRGPGQEGALRRASALHGIAADQVHHPAAIDRLVTGLAGLQHHDGSWGEGDLFHVGQALLSVEHPMATEALGRAVVQLRRWQQADGGFGGEERSWIACRWAGRWGAGAPGR